MKYPNLLDQFEMIMQHVQDENYPEVTATVATFKMRLVDFEEELQKAREKVSEYQYANAHLHAEIGELKEGVPIEKADKDGTEYFWFSPELEEWVPVCWCKTYGWNFRNPFVGIFVSIEPERLYIIPSQTQEGS